MSMPNENFNTTPIQTPMSTATTTTTTTTTTKTSTIGADDYMTGAVVVCASGGASSSEEFFEMTTQKFELERLGMTVSTKFITITKDDSNLIGISIGGGAPLCPCLYIVQVFDGTPAARNGCLESGDELLAINNVNVKGKTKVQVAKMIQEATQQVTIHYNKLHADPERGKSLDIILKKLKHRIVDNMSSNTADSLGLSRAILCNDSLVKRLEELEGTEIMYKGMVEHAKRILKSYYELFQSYRHFGDCFTDISTREPQMRASEVFRTFGEFHRQLEKDGLDIIKQIKPILNDMGTYLHKAIPDTKLTVKRYMDAKFTYLSYCLKVKEMDDEEHGFAYIQEPLYRVETGNYEYRLILRCRQDARFKFAKLRNDVLEKMELLECKHANDLTTQLRGLLDTIKQLYLAVVKRMDNLPHLFPIEVDFKETDFQYKSSILEPQMEDDNEEEKITRNDSPSSNKTATTITPTKTSEKIKTYESQFKEKFTEIACGVEAIEEPQSVVHICAVEENGAAALTKVNENHQGNAKTLLEDLGLLGIDLNVKSTSTLNERESVDISAVANETIGPNSSNNETCNFELFLHENASNISDEKITKENVNECSEQDLMVTNALETDLLLQ